MDKNKRSMIIFALKILIPIIVVIILFLGGINAGVITFEKEKIKTGDITATIKIDFADGTIYQNVLPLKNATVFDFLLEIEKIGDIEIKTNVESGGYEINSINYNGKKYVHGQDGYWWLFYVNEQFAMDSADKTYVKNNDLIEWKYEKF